MDDVFGFCLKNVKIILYKEQLSYLDCWYLLPPAVIFVFSVQIYTQKWPSHGNIDTFKSIGKTNTVAHQTFTFLELTVKREVVYKICQKSVVEKRLKSKGLQRDSENS